MVLWAFFMEMDMYEQLRKYNFWKFDTRKLRVVVRWSEAAGLWKCYVVRDGDVLGMAYSGAPKSAVKLAVQYARWEGA